MKIPLEVLYTWKELLVARLQLYKRKIYEAAIVDKTDLKLLKSPLSPHSMLINERLTQRENRFSTKQRTIATLEHCNWGKWGNGNIKVDFLVLH